MPGPFPELVTGPFEVSLHFIHIAICGSRPDSIDVTFTCSEVTHHLGIILYAENVDHAFTRFGEIIQIITKQPIDFEACLVDGQIITPGMKFFEVTENLSEAFLQNYDVTCEPVTGPGFRMLCLSMYPQANDANDQGGHEEIPVDQSRIQDGDKSTCKESAENQDQCE